MSKKRKRRLRATGRNPVLRLTSEGNLAQAAAPELFRTRVVPTSEQKLKQRPRGSNRRERLFGRENEAVDDRLGRFVGNRTAMDVWSGPRARRMFPAT